MRIHVAARASWKPIISRSDPPISDVPGRAQWVGGTYSHGSRRVDWTRVVALRRLSEQ
jgi:hypothetical protein